MDVLDRQQRRQRLKLLDNRITLYTELKAKRGLTDDELETFLSDLRELAKLQRIDRSEGDVLYFMYEYFSPTFDLIGRKAP